MKIALGVLVLVVVAAVGYLVLRPGSLSGTEGAAETMVDTSTETVSTNVEFTVIAQGVKSTVTERKNYLVSTQAGLDRLWKMIDATSTPPKIDFDKRAIAAVFAGTQPTGGYSIAVSEIRDSGSNRTVTATLTSPSGNCELAAKKISPYQIIELPVSNLSLSHRDLSETTSCE